MHSGIVLLSLLNEPEDLFLKYSGSITVLLYAAYVYVLSVCIIHGRIQPSVYRIFQIQNILLHSWYIRVLCCISFCVWPAFIKSVKLDSRHTVLFFFFKCVVENHKQKDEQGNLFSILCRILFSFSVEKINSFRTVAAVSSLDRNF